MPAESTGWNPAAAAAAAWCAVFAALHLFWAVGGSLGLASSAGSSLAARRPGGFVAGLYGLAALLALGVVVIWLVSTAPTGRYRRALRILIGVAGAVLVFRGGVLEVLLGLDLGGIRAAVGPLETHWSLVLWNPWFVLGGGLLIVAAVRSRPPARP